MRDEKASLRNWEMSGPRTAWVQALEAPEASRCPGSTCVGGAGEGGTVLGNSHLSLSRMSGSWEYRFFSDKSLHCFHLHP